MFRHHSTTPTTRPSHWMVIGSLPLLFWAARLPAAVLDLEIVDERDRPVPARVLVRPAGGECVVPEGAVELRVGPDRWFMSAGKSRVEVPVGGVQVRVERGLEYVRYKQDMEVSGPETALPVVLRRWVDMHGRGYLCGENHIHVETSLLGPMLVAEGLDFGTSLTWWNGPDSRRPVPLGDGRTRLLDFADRQIETSVYDAELEYGWGAAYLMNLPEPMPLKNDRGRPNLDYLTHACESGGLVAYQAGWSREVALNALLGRVHMVNVCNNNFHLHQFQPRSRYSNLLQVEGFPIYPDTDVGMMRMNTDTYYRLLNWGRQLAAGAGSACGVKENPVGYNRAYVQVDRKATLFEFLQEWAAGRNFVTNGPMLLLETADGARPGSTIALADGGRDVSVRVTATAEPHQVLTSVEIVVNGQVAHSFDLDQEHELTGQVTLPVTQGAWIAARCTCRDDLLSDAELASYARGGDKQPFRQRPSRLRYAHTSPIYVTVDGRETAVRKSIEEGLRMLDRFEQFARETTAARYLPATLEAIKEARQKLQLRLQAAREV